MIALSVIRPGPVGRRCRAARGAVRFLRSPRVPRCAPRGGGCPGCEGLSDCRGVQVAAAVRKHRLEEPVSHAPREVNHANVQLRAHGPQEGAVVEFGVPAGHIEHLGQVCGNSERVEEHVADYVRRPGGQAILGESCQVGVRLARVAVLHDAGETCQFPGGKRPR